MKRITFFIAFVFFFSSPYFVHAGGAAGAAIAESIFLQDMIQYAADLAIQGKQVYEMVESVLTAKEQLENIIASEKRAIKNLKSVLDVRSFGDFMNWFNRQIYLSQKAEASYSELGVSIGKNNIKLSEIDKIPDALRNTFHDPFDKDFTEEEKYQMYTQLGLSPSNYMYLKTWQVEGEDLTKRIMTYGGIFSEEAEEAAWRNREIMDKYMNSSEDSPDANEIAKQSGLSLAQIEMAIREQNNLLMLLHKWLLVKDKENSMPPSPPRLSPDYKQPMFERITGGSGRSSYTYPVQH